MIYPRSMSRHPFQRRKMPGIRTTLGVGAGSQTVLNGAIVQKGKIVERSLAAFPDPAKRERNVDLYAPPILLHRHGGVEPGINAVRRYNSAFRTVFPEARATAWDTLEIQDKVVVRFLIPVTYRGPILDLNATEKSIRLARMTIIRFEGRKCRERWSVTDFLALAVQFWTFPGPG